MHLALEAVIESSSKLPFPVQAHSVKADKHFFASSEFLEVLTEFNLLICLSQTSVLSMILALTLSPPADLYLLTPTITSPPNSIQAYLFAALS